MLKKFLAFSFFGILSIFTFWLIFSSISNSGKIENIENLKEAMFYEKLSGGYVRCNLCPRHCILANKQIGYCRARENIGGKLYSLTYGKIAALHLDPVEKKPFFHVLPGSKIFSIATTGCNLRCLYCQNWDIAQVFPWKVRTINMTPSEVVQKALKSGAQGIAFTYNEPIVFYEYMLDIAKEAKKAGLKTLVVSAGYIEKEPLKELLKYITAFKVDLKGFNEKFYREVIGGKLQPVLETLKTIKESGTWLEIVYLIIPGKNDNEKEIREMARWIKENLGPDVPLHFSRFYPMYKLKNLPPTPIEAVKKLRKIATEEGLHFVYTGNIPDIEGQTTFCPKSKKPVIIRNGFLVVKNDLKDGECPDGEKIPGIWK